MSNNNNNNNSTNIMNYNGSFTVQSDKCQYTPTSIISEYTYQTTIVDGTIVEPVETKMKFRTERTLPKLGVLLVGLGGNNGSTCVAGALANKMNLTWETKEGTKKSNYWGSLMLASTVKLGNDRCGNSVFVPIHNMLPMIHPNDIVWGGWDINNTNLGDAMKRAAVLDYNLQQKLYPYMKDIIPMPSIYSPDFIAANQHDRANNILPGCKQVQLDTLRQNIREFKQSNGLDEVIVLWTANTERFVLLKNGLNDTASNIIASIERDEEEISPSTIFAVASILEHCSFINGSPQNTFVPGVIDLAHIHKVFIAGDDFKSGQTKIKSVLIDFLVSAGIKPVSIVSYNHLGNNDGKNLSSPSQFQSKEISKTNVVDDMVASNNILFNNEINTNTNTNTNTKKDQPDHVVVIKYVPYVGDSKRAMDEYSNEIFMGGRNTIVMHNTCEDSLLAVPLIYDLIILAELCSRITVKKVQQHDNNGFDTVDDADNGDDNDQFESFHPVLSLLSYMLKAPLVPAGAPVVNALFTQRQAIVNVLRACLALPPENHMTLEHRFESSLNELLLTSSSSSSVSSLSSQTKQESLTVANTATKKRKYEISADEEKKDN